MIKIVKYILFIVLHIFYIVLILLRFIKLEDIIPKNKSETNFKEKAQNTYERMFIIDDDVGMFKDGVWKQGTYWLNWLKITDPDGGLELIYALREPRIKILGITTMMGVAHTDLCVQSAKNILKIMRREDIPVLKGAETPRDLGKETEAARFIVEMVKKYPKKVEIIATGPLTNIATAIMMEPELPELWHTLHFATGEFRGKLGDKSELYYMTLVGIPDLNINVDPKATLYVLRHGGDFPIYPNELMDDVFLNKGDYQQIKYAGKLGSILARFIAYELKIFNFLTSYFTPFGRGIATHGVVPVGVILDNTLECKIIESGVVMIDYGYQGYAFDLSNDPKMPTHKIYVRLTKADKEIMHNRLIKRLY